MKLGKIVIVVFAVWLIPVISLSAWMVLTPNVLVREASAGSVIAVTTHHSWVVGGDLTTLKTTLGTFQIEGLHSAPRGQRLVIRDTTKAGEQVCTEGGSDTCAAFSGSYLGALTPVPHRPVLLSYVLRQNLWALTAIWGIVGGVVSAMFAMFWVLERVGNCDVGAGGGADLSES